MPAPQYGLDGFGHYRPVVVQIGDDLFPMDDQFVEALERRADRQQGMSQRNAEVAQYGRVGQVALHPRDG